jgi:acyl-CoA thioesterase
MASDRSGGAKTSAAVSPQRVVEHLLSVSPVAHHWGVEILEAERGAVSLGMDIRPDMSNTNDVCQGGVIFTLADFCFGYAASTYNDRATAAACDINFLKPGKVGDRLTARATEVWRRGRSGLYDVTVTNQDDDIIAVMRGHARLIGGVHVEEG